MIKMDVHRSVILATVVGVNDGNVLYPCCIQCYAKMVHNLHMNKWECVRCNMRCTEAELTWRYRLSLCVADSSATCHLSLFGGTLIQHFGCSGKDFHRFIVSQYGDKQGTGEIILRAAQAALVGKSFIFCLKTNTPVAPTADTESTHRLPSTSHSLCLADLLESQPASSNNSDGKLSDFVAVQMIQTGSQGEGTVMGVLKAMEREAEQNASSFPGHVTNSIRSTSQLQSQICSHGRSASSHTANFKGTGIQQNHRFCASLIHGPSRMSAQVCEDHDDHCECSQGASGHSSFGTSLSQDSSVGQSSLRFSCQSSMDKEFSSQTDQSSSESRSQESVSDSQRIFKRGDAAREVITENTADFDQSAAVPTSGRTGMKTGRRKNKTRTKKRLPRLQLKCDTARRDSETCSSLRKQSANKVHTDKHRMNADATAGNNISSCSGFDFKLPVLGQNTNCQDWDKHFSSQKPDLKHRDRECGMNEDTAVGDQMSTCSDFESTVPVLSQSSMDVNHHDQDKHSRSKQAHLNLSDIKESFSSSLNDSSFLLGAMQANMFSPFVDVCVPACSRPVEKAASLATRIFCDEAVHCASDNLRQADPSLKVRQAVPTLSIPTNNMSRAIPKDDGHQVDLPHSEDLSLFLDRMASYPADINQIPFETLGHASLQEKTIACNRHASNSELVQLGGSAVCRKNLSCSFALSNSSGILSESHHASQTSHGSSTPKFRSCSPTLEGIAGVTARKTNYEMNVNTELLPEDQLHDSTVLLDYWHEAFTLEQKYGLTYNKLSSRKTLQPCPEQVQQKSVNALSETFCCNRGEALPSDHMLKQHSHPCMSRRTLIHTVHEGHHMAHTEEERSVLLGPESEDLNSFLNKMGNCNCGAECECRNLRSDHADRACQQPVLEAMEFPVSSLSRSCTLPVPQITHLADSTNNVHCLDVLALEKESQAQTQQKSPPIVTEVKTRTRKEEKEPKVTTSRLGSSKKRILVSNNSDRRAPSEDLILNNYETSDIKLCLKYSESEEGLPGTGQAMNDSVLDGSVDLFISHEATADPDGTASTPCTDKLTRACENSFPCLLTPVSKNQSDSCSSMGISTDLRMKLKKERSRKACKQSGQWQKYECSSQEANSISLRYSILSNAHNHSASAQTDRMNQVLLSSIPEALQPKKVRFSCNRRVSTVGAMDARLESYMSPQQNAGQWQPRTLTRTPHTSKSCMKQTVSPARTHLKLSSETPRNIITFRSQIRSPLSPITDLHNTKGDSLLSDCRLTKKQQFYSTPKLHHGRVSLFGHRMKYPEVSQLGLDTEPERQSQYPFCSQCDYSGSQDLFSPLKDRVLLPAQSQQAGSGDVGHNVLSTKDRVQTAGDLIPDVRMLVEENKSQSPFDNSDELFDNSEVTMCGCDNTCDLGACQKQNCDSCTPKATESYADIGQTDEGNFKKHVVPSTPSLRHTVIPNFSASYLFSPDLFSP